MTATWKDVMDPVTTAPVRFPDNITALTATPQSSSNNTPTGSNGRKSNIDMVVDAAADVGNDMIRIGGDEGAKPGRDTGRKACAKSSAGSTASSFTTSATDVVSNGSRRNAWLLPKPLEIKPGVAAESALRLLTAYVRRLRITKDIEAEAEE